MRFLNATGEAIFIHEADTGKLLDVNRTMESLYGCTREQAMEQDLERFSEGVSPYSSAEVAVWIRKAITEGPQLFEWRARRWNKELFWCEIQLKKIELGGQSRVLAVVRETTERHQLEEQLRQSQKLDSVGQLAAGVAHDFNNILTVIRLNASLLSDITASNPECQELVGDILSVGERGANLTRQMLLFSRKTSNPGQRRPAQRHHR